MPALTLALLTFALVPGGDTRDEAVLTIGKTRKGRVLLVTEDELVLRTGSTSKTISRKKVKSFTSVAFSLGEVLDTYRKTKPKNLPALLGLAKLCRERKLPPEERILLWKVLLADPNNAEANARLGHEERRKGWVGTGERGSVRVADADTKFAGTAKGFNFRSEHVEPFHAKTLVKLNETPHFSPAENTLYVRLDKRGRALALFHEGTHAIVHNLGAGAKASRGSFPGWLHEGWAVYMGGIMRRRKNGKVDVFPSAIQARHVQTVRSAKKPYDLHRVLNFESDDFRASTKRGLKYAQSYVLFHYMLLGAEELRPRFFAYLREALAGKGQASTFRRIFRKELRAIEKEHVAHRG